MGINELIADSRVTLTRKEYNELATSPYPEAAVQNPAAQQPHELTQATVSTPNAPADKLITEDENWEDLANCLGVDPSLFFPEKGASTREAKAVCRACVVREACLDYSLKNGEKFGIWGGMSERERRRIRRQRAVGRTASLDTLPH